jgi:hypothetical protein
MVCRDLDQFQLIAPLSNLCSLLADQWVAGGVVDYCASVLEDKWIGRRGKDIQFMRFNPI